MKAHILLFTVLLCAMISNGQNKKIAVNYPETKKVPQKDVYFGKEVEDPYRWLEDDRSEETAEWVKAENEVTFNYLNQIPYRKDMASALTSMWNYPKEGSPFRKGNKYFFWENNGLQNQSVLYVKDRLDGEARELINPNKLSKDGTVSISAISVSNDGKYIAYSVSKGGSDWQEAYVKTIEGKELADHLQWMKSSSLSWYKDGFFYSCYDEPTGSKLSQKNEYQKVFYHKLGMAQSEDILIYEDKNPENSTRMYQTSTTEDEKYLILYIYKSTSSNMLLYKSLNELQENFTTLIDNFNSDYSLVDNQGDDLFFYTNANAPMYKLVKLDAKNPSKGFVDIITESKDVLSGIAMAGGRFVTLYLHNAYSRLAVFSKDGKFEKEVKLPEIGSVTGLSSSKNSNEIFFKFMSFSCPGDNYKYDVIQDKDPVLINKAELSFTPSKYITEQVFFKSKDGTKVPMFIVYKEGVKKTGKNPLLLYGYGGFNVSQTPVFSIARMLFLENNGIIVTVNLRGGGEFGKAWHEAGTRLKKQNVFDDFIAAAEYLIKEKYTSKEKIAIQGGSNGGLLVGACMTQRPDLFKVALPAVGVLDMLRFHKFTVGWAWKDDYGSSEKEEEFNYITRYSPLHNVKGNVCYPATLITTGDHDDRVVPAHSFKFAAELQSKQKCDNPVLIRIETMAGHGAGKPTSKSIEEAADIWAFTFYNLNMDYKNPVKK